MKRFPREMIAYYQALRLDHGVREAVRLTAEHTGKTRGEVCDLLGLDRKYAEEKKDGKT